MMGSFITLVILAIAVYVAILIHELGHFMVCPHGKVVISLNPIRSFAVLWCPKSREGLLRPAGMAANLAVAFLLPPYFNIGGLFGAFITAVGFASFYSAILVNLISGGLLLHFGPYTSDATHMFGKNFRIASAILVIALVIVFQYYIVNLPAFLKAFLP
ncbi:hypothetical protein HY546_00265 [archaeon]|nr:hypothetical protein [archaeon]